MKTIPFSPSSSLAFFLIINSVSSSSSSFIIVHHVLRRHRHQSRTRAISRQRDFRRSRRGTGSVSMPFFTHSTLPGGSEAALNLYHAPLCCFQSSRYQSYSCSEPNFAAFKLRVKLIRDSHTMLLLTASRPVKASQTTEQYHGPKHPSSS